MALSGAERARRHRDKRRGGPAREPEPCGTRAAIARHVDNPTKWGALRDCPICSPVETERQAAYHQARRTSPQPGPTGNDSGPTPETP